MRTVLAAACVTAVLAIAQDSRTLAKHTALDMQRLIAEGNLVAVRYVVPEAEQHIEKLGLADPTAALLVNQIAILEQMLGNYAQAVRIYENAIRKAEKLDSQSLGLAILMLNLARTHLEAYDGPKYAHIIAQRALTLATALFGADSPMLGMFYVTLADSLRQQGDRKQARELYERAFGLGRDGSELSGYQFALILQNMGMLEAQERKWGVASQHLHEAIALQIEVNGPRTVNLIRPYMNLAQMHAMRKEWDDARENASKARELADLQLAADHPIKKELFALSAEIARKSGHRDEAREWERRRRGLQTPPAPSSVHVSDLMGK